MMSGREAIEKGHGAAISAGLSNTVVNVDQAHLAGETIWAVGDWTQTGPGANNATQSYHGNWGAVYVRTAGVWQIRMLTSNIIEARPQ
jgi:hypothetical protein